MINNLQEINGTFGGGGGNGRLYKQKNCQT